MEIETLKETLLEALNIQSKAIGGRSSVNIPILANVLLKADTSKLFLYTTNLEINIITWIAANVLKTGTTTVSLKRFLDYINTQPEGDLKLHLENNELMLISKTSHAAFTTIPPEEFPKVTDIKEEPICTINSILFFEAINLVGFSASKDDTRPTFTGIYIEINQTSIDFVAIDGFRMSKKKVMIETGVTSTISFIVPSVYIEEIAKLQGSKSEDVKLFIIGNKNQLGLRYKNSDFVIRLIEGVYPDYSKIIPEEFTTNVVIDRHDLLDAVKISSIFAAQKDIAKTKIQIEEDYILLKSSQKEIGANETRIEARVKGETGSITFNSRFLQDAINHLDCEKIILRIVLKQEKPSIFYDSKLDKNDEFLFDDSYFNLMTPIKIENE